MIGRLHTFVYDCPDPERLAGFYSELLGRPVTLRDEGWVVIGDRDEWPVLAFQPAEGLREPRWPDPERPQQAHMDIWVEDIDTAEQRVLEMGATLLRTEENGTGVWFRVYSDPAGHPFCLEYEAR
ncbi:VOC family protein [Nocardiopsis changdeensis]|uniref:VOC family protein n=1 Tax=Nocardiopsis changdeensis TaxID=2831969 RepID=A0ABX8BLJ6_9ACTN|nr:MULTISPECIES: VOC family protein [Nocardiopsis]QUX22887.1 VOC family protein [Nocardiopsis changdeensis]QYX38830.1 VOC family protein [Nocardiopsis sp. MT53]